MMMFSGGSGYLEVEDSMLAEIVKEVTSPKPIQAQIDQFLSDFFKFVKKIEFPKKSIKNLEHFPWYKFEEKFKFSGGSIASCNPLGALKSKTLGIHFRIDLDILTLMSFSISIYKAQ